MTRTYRQKRELNKALAAVGLIVGVLLFAAGMIPLFNWIDCNNAEKFIRYHDRCLLNANCTLNTIELSQMRRYTKLALMRCNHEDTK